MSKDDIRTTNKELQQLKGSIDLLKANVIPTLRETAPVAEGPQP